MPAVLPELPLEILALLSWDSYVQPTYSRPLVPVLELVPGPAVDSATCRRSSPLQSGVALVAILPTASCSLQSLPGLLVIPDTYNGDAI